MNVCTKELVVRVEINFDNKSKKRGNNKKSQKIQYHLHLKEILKITYPGITDLNL